MSGRKRRRKTDIAKTASPAISKDESFTDFLCPICLQILIEPVQMPCKHELCMQCFKMHVENTSLQCPMCRLRISTWHRKNVKTNSLINHERWELIKKLYPDRVERRMNGEDDLESSYRDYNAPKHVIAPEGELRKEYEIELKKLEEERQAINKANMEYINQLEKEDIEARQLQQEFDEQQAKKLQQEEMKNLGVTLKSPTEHQRKLLALYKPKSPMKLRGNRAVATKTKVKETHKRKIDLSSPNHTITNFFNKKLSSTPLSSTKNSQDTPSCSHTLTERGSEDKATSSSKNDSDLELARQLQKQFDVEIDTSPNKRTKKEPFRRKNNSPLGNVIVEKQAMVHSSGKRKKQENIHP